jgi:formylglycine-generating enzyme required for sulfatase activity
MRLLLAAALVASAAIVRAQTITLDMVPVGNAGNAADTTGYGSVGYNYDIGKYDVTTAQYTAFLNAVATESDPYGLYYSSMAVVGSSGSSYGCGIVQSGTAGSYTYSVAPAYQNFPVNWITWGDAARFCNWLDNGQPSSGTEAAGTTETGAYALDGATSQAALMAVSSPAHSGVSAPTYFLPTENEFYKAAHFDHTLNGGNGGYWTYPTKSNLAPSNSLVLASTSNNDANYDNGGYTDPANYLTPVGTFAASPGPYGTYDMGGDVWQWNETSISGSCRGLRGGSWINNSSSLASSLRNDYYPADENFSIGFRVASSVAVPEPGSLALLLAGAVAFGAWRKRRKA